jgi:hypothetical protein
VEHSPDRIEPEASETKLGSVGVHGRGGSRKEAGAYCAHTIQNVSGGAKDLSRHCDDDGAP